MACEGLRVELIQGQAHDPAEFRRRLTRLFTSRDVVWSPADPMPFLLMTPMSWEILWPAITTEMTLGEATQRDIAWMSDGVYPDGGT